MTRYIIKETRTEGLYKGRIAYFGKGGWEIDARRPIKECEAYASRASANRTRRCYERLHEGYEGYCTRSCRSKWARRFEEA